MMTIKEAIDKWYRHFIAFAKNTDTLVYNGRSTDDIVHDMMLMALRKWGEDNVDGQVLYDYLQKSIAMQLKLSKKKKSCKEVPYDSVNSIDTRYSYTPEYDIMVSF